MLSITSICPSCKTRYRVSVLQLRIAQGNVNCFKCAKNFNAYHCISDQYKPKRTPQTTDLHLDNLPQHNDHPTLEIFNHKSNASNISLQTYLNNTSYTPSESLTQKRQYPIKISPFKGLYRPKKFSFSMFMISIISVLFLGLSILIALAYSLIGIG
ncbi:hypothetical protein I2F27_05095 [Acinetobacter sp. B5B]|uniref:MJ0042-type zinc finger domain-containing protein n=1 Tax=Acinetobacter baretiae TaxID=2605383 RepID=UPI0018C2112D|nr:MJ0042-type zinc finger domain-containing protein [Acinetobacter baretiae]MBF7682710.1 hypothetical protein [Acinetobacter baretiae]MBF7684944.1 hypothetical protein [Acinetobacter baretiae]